LARAPELVAFRESVPVVAASLTAVAVPVTVAREVAAPVTAKAVLTAFREKPARKILNPATRPVEMELTPSRNTQPIAEATLASLKKDAASAETLFVVMRTREVGPEGASWTIRVWQFTVLKPEQIPAGLKVPAKST
jgi:hypothetical protein